jgi:hypothetical protein
VTLAVDRLDQKHSQKHMGIQNGNAQVPCPCTNTAYAQSIIMSVFMEEVNAGLPLV